MASKTRESSLWTWLRGAERDLRPDLRMERVENAVSCGTPDVDGVLNGRHFKIELKTVARPARKSTGLRIKFQPAQPNWLRSWCASGGNAFVLVQVGSGPVARRYLVPGKDVDALSVPDLTEEGLLYRAILWGSHSSAAEVVRTAANYPIKNP